MYSLPPQIRNIFNKITEKTIEVNCMSELVKLFSPSYVVTVLGPSRIQEKQLGFDDILAGLPPGRTFALQFKKPFLRGRHQRFTLNVSQLQVLLRRFGRREAFFVLSHYFYSKRAWSFDELAKSVMEGEVGRKRPVEKKEFKKEEKKRYGGPNYYIHVAHKREVTREQ